MLKTISWSNFTFLRADGLGSQLKDRLAAKARQGVRVYVLYDEVGSNDLPDTYLSAMTAAGIQAHKFNTTKGRANRFQINFRNHRKIVVVDGQEAWVGGHNVGDEYLGKDPTSGPWRDTHMRVCGPVVQAIQLTFAEDWHWASGAMLDLEWQPEPCASGRSVAALALPSGPADILETCTLFFIKAIQSAERRLWIASPYFVPDEQFITALQLAVLKGVDVRLMIPRKTDNMLVSLTHWAYITPLQQLGVKVYWYDKGFMHQKGRPDRRRLCHRGNRQLRQPFVPPEFRDHRRGGRSPVQQRGCPDAGGRFCPQPAGQQGRYPRQRTLVPVCGPCRPAYGPDSVERIMRLTQRRDGATKA